MPWNPADFDAEWPFDLRATRFDIDPAHAALLVIDFQVACVAFDAESDLAKRYPAIAAYWNARMDGVAIPNTRRLIERFRRDRRKIVYSRMGCLTATGEEAVDRLKPRCYPAPLRPGVPAFDVDPRLAPTPDDLVIDKLGGSAFTATCLDFALRNMGVRQLVVTGCLTDQCVTGTARAATDLGYDTLLVEDACVTYTPRAHTEALLMHARRFGRVATTEGVLAELDAPRAVLK